jgi:Lrp/AsnC family leucine-responsive transcriptional regulator
MLFLKVINLFKSVEMKKTDNFSSENLDIIDFELLRMLQKDAKLTTKEIAIRVNLSPTPVYERIKRLEKEGLIEKYTAIVNAEKVGKNLTVFCNIILKEHTKEIVNKFVRDIVSLKEVSECYNISGDYDFLLKIIIRDMKHYQFFVINELGSVENIGSAHSTFVIGVTKHSYGVPL